MLAAKLKPKTGPKLREVKAKTRHPEVDILRGFAIVAMIAYHFMANLKIIYRYDPMSKAFWTFAPDFIGGTFIFVVGVSLFLSSQKADFKKFFRRGLKILAWAMGITLFTLVDPLKGFIYFGVLHCIGFCIILSYPFMKKISLRVVGGLGVGITLLGNYFVYIMERPESFFWLFWAGVLPNERPTTVDYYPLLPWFGVCLLGIWVGRRFYKNGTSPLGNLTFGGLGWAQILGRYSLVIYLLHQPLLFGLMWGFSKLN